MITSLEVGRGEGLFLKTAPIVACNLLSLRAGLYEVVGKCPTKLGCIHSIDYKMQIFCPKASDPETGAG